MKCEHRWPSDPGPHDRCYDCGIQYQQWQAQFGPEEAPPDYVRPEDVVGDE